MAEKYYNKKPPEFGMIEYSGGLIFVPDISGFFFVKFIVSIRYKTSLEGHFRARGGE
jgi:hypothetical protein